MDFELLYNYFEGLTGEEENQRIKAWLASNPENERRLLAERKIYDAITFNCEEADRQSGLPTGYVSPKKTTTIARPAIHTLIREIVKIAAIFLIAFPVNRYFLSHRGIGSDEASLQTINVPVGQRLNITLSDGTDVWLNGGTTIRYPGSFNRNERMVTIDGQAFFDVAANEKIPFTVKSPSGTIRALGTKFDVLDYSASHVFETMLMEGSVKVELTGSALQSIILAPEEKSVVEDGRLGIVRVHDQSAYLWKEGLIGFRNEPLESIMKSFEKTFDITIVIENNNVKDVVFTGKFRIVDGVEYALRVLQLNADFYFVWDVDRQVIHIR